MRAFFLGINCTILMVVLGLWVLTAGSRVFEVEVTDGNGRFLAEARTVDASFYVGTMGVGVGYTPFSLLFLLFAVWPAVEFILWLRRKRRPNARGFSLDA